MRLLKILAGLAVCIMGITLVLSAAPNKYGVADTRQIQFDRTVRVGDVLLPIGEYKIVHLMEGDNHIMVFKQINTKKPAEARIQCHLVTLATKADRTETLYSVNDAKEWVLQELTFKGDLAKHVF